MSKRGKVFLRRQLVALLTVILVAILIWTEQQTQFDVGQLSPKVEQQYFGTDSALEALEKIQVKGRSPKTDYSRSQFGDGWQNINGCDTRNIILARDLTDTVIDEQCLVRSGILNDPYTGETILFSRGQNSNAIQIDHVVALSDAWQKGAQQLSQEKRVEFANDPLNLLAVDGPANQQKGDGDAATWLPPNKPFRCQYVARQVAVKVKYHLWMTEAEKQTIQRILNSCTQQQR